MPRFAVLIAHPLHFGLLKPGDKVEKWDYHHIADIEAENTDEAYERCQNNIPHRTDPDGSWAREAHVTLTPEGERLKYRQGNDSIRSLSVGDILIHEESGEHYIVASAGFYILDDAGMEYEVVG